MLYACWMKNGTILERVGFLIDPYDEKTQVFHVVFIFQN